MPYVHAGHDIVKMDDDILGLVADNDEEASFLLLDAIADERRNARVSVTQGMLESMPDTRGK